MTDKTSDTLKRFIDFLDNNRDSIKHKRHGLKHELALQFFGWSDGLEIEPDTIILLVRAYKAFFNLKTELVKSKYYIRKDEREKIGKALEEYEKNHPFHSFVGMVVETGETDDSRES